MTPRDPQLADMKWVYFFGIKSYGTDLIDKCRIIAKASDCQTGDANFISILQEFKELKLKKYGVWTLKILKIYGKW